MYEVVLTETFKKNLEKLTSKDPQLLNRVKATLKKLALNPQHPGLNSHKVNTRKYGIRWSSWGSGDIRIIWDFAEDKMLTIEALDIGSHSGTRKVYH